MYPLGSAAPGSQRDGVGDGRDAGRQVAAVDLDRALDERRLLPAAAAVEDAVGVLLALRDVGLVERVDADQPAGDRRGVLPGQELRAERAVDRHVRVDPAAGHGVRPERAAVGDGEHVGAGGAGAGGRLDDDRQDAAAVLAGGLGDQLLGPVAEADDAGAVGDQRHLVPAGQGRRAERRAQHERRVVARAGQGLVELLGLVEQLGHVDAGQRAGHQAERGERAVPAAHLGVGEHHVGAHLAGGGLQRRTRVGDTTKRPPTSSSPASSNAVRYARRWLSVSTVDPDLLATTTTVRPSRSPSAAPHLVRVGGVEDGQRYVERVA